MSFDRDKMQEGVHLLLQGMGYDPQKPGLVETPRRVAEMYEEVLAGLDKDPVDVIKVLNGEEYDEIVLVREIPFYSLCEHHLLPFHGEAHVAYIPENNRITGLSKLARVVELYARRLQVQERMSRQIADSLMHTLAPKGVMVVLEAEHLCMTMRGVQKPGSLTVTSVVRGIFRDNQATRSEAITLIEQGR
ncbi:MAG: GTP cyclohydrolase I FolE [Planctomycetota bacterium]